MNVPLAIDLATLRVAYPADPNIGYRLLSLTKGTSYAFAFSFFSGASPVSFPVSGLSFSIAASNNKDYPVLSISGVNGTGFNLTAASPVLDYALGGSDSLIVETDITFSGNGSGYVLQSLPTQIFNSAEISPSTEYYPLSNPSGFVTASALTGLQAQVAALTGLNFLLIE